MSNTIVPIQGTANVTVPANGKIATNGAQQYQVIQNVGYPNFPTEPLVLFQGTGRYTSSAFTSGASITVNAGSSTADYNVGASAAIVPQPYQPTPGTLNATGTLTAALILGGIVTSTSAAAVAATLDTGTVMDAAITMSVGDSFDWSLINTGPNTVTVTAASGHTIVGTATVVTVVSGRFRTLKTAAATFVTYRLA